LRVYEAFLRCLKVGEINPAVGEPCPLALQRNTMPKQSEGQIIGREGEIWFESQLPSGWVLQPPKSDVGVDGVVVICDTSDLNGREFRIQVKASKKPKIRESNIVISRLKYSTIEYWFLSPLPTLIVFYDATEKCGYYRWHIDIYEEVRESLKDKDEK